MKSDLSKKEQVNSKSSQPKAGTQTVARPKSKGTKLPRTSGKPTARQPRNKVAMIKNENYFHSIIEQSSEGVTLIDEKGHIIEWNQANEKITGLKRSEVFGMKYWDVAMKMTVPERRTPQNRERIKSMVLEALRTGKSALFERPIEAELYSRPSRGKQFIHEIIFPIKTKNGYRIASLTQDITERKQTEAKILHINRLYATISQINQAIVRAQDRDTLFSEICRVAIEHGKFRMAWIGLIDEAEEYVKPIVFAGEEQGYLTNISIVIHDPKLGSGPTGTSIREGRCIICQDIATDPRMTPWREQAMQRGYRSSAAVPIRQKDRLVGALTVYASDLQGFDDDDQKLLDEIGQDISFALNSMETESERKQAEEALCESEDLYRDLVENSHDLICTHDLEGKLLSVNETAVRLTGYSREDLLQMDMVNLLAPDMHRFFSLYLKKIQSAGHARGLM